MLFLAIGRDRGCWKRLARVAVSCRVGRANEIWGPPHKRRAASWIALRQRSAELMIEKLVIAYRPCHGSDWEATCAR